MKEKDGGVNLIDIHCKYIQKCHNVSTAQLLYDKKESKKCE
jgi:hypothetical protein